MTDELIRLRSFATRFEAETAKSFLEGNGVRAFVSADDGGGWWPHLLLGSGGAHLLVRKVDLETASQLLEADIGADTADVTDETDES